MLKEGRHPTREELDTVSTTVPVFVQDSSGHHGAVNSLMLKNLNVTAATPDPEGAGFGAARGAGRHRRGLTGWRVGGAGPAGRLPGAGGVGRRLPGALRFERRE